MSSSPAQPAKVSLPMLASRRRPSVTSSWPVATRTTGRAEREHPSEVNGEARPELDVERAAPVGVTKGPAPTDIDKGDAGPARGAASDPGATTGTGAVPGSGAPARLRGAMCW